MINVQKPKIGFLGMMTDIYDESQPEVTANQEKFAKEVVDRFKDSLDIDFPGIAKSREEIERIVKYFNDKEYDGMMVVNLIYSPSGFLIQALQNNKLPLLIACIQPLPSVTKDWNWSFLTTNQGMHGFQDTGNIVMRTSRIKPTILVDDWKSESFKSFLIDWSAVVNTIAQLKKTRIAVFGRVNGMGDIKGDDIAFCKKFGIEVNEENLGSIVHYMDAITSEEIDKQIEEDKKNFEIESKLPEERHRYASKLQIAFEKFIIDNNYRGLSHSCLAFGEDGRFKQINILGATNLLAKGYGYAGEGDSNTVTLTIIGHMMLGDPHFTEMYSLDFKKDAALMCHMGEGNWKVARKDRPVKLIDRPLDIGGLENPPTTVFSPEPGPAILVSLAAIEGRQYRMVVSRGTVLDTEEIPGITLPYCFFKPDIGIKKSMEEWLMKGGTHHEVMFLGDPSRRLKMFCKILDIEYVEV